MQWQIASLIALQQNAGLTGWMQFLTFLGKEEFFLLLIPLVYLCFDVRAGIRLGILVLVGDALNLLAKYAFHAPRPYWIDARVQALATESSYGFPSGHAQNAASVWLFLGWWRDRRFKRFWLWTALVALIFLISLSRLYLGVHFWTDVFGGWVLGVLFLAAFCRFIAPLENWFESRALKTQVFAVAALVLLLLLSGCAARWLAIRAGDAPAWAHFADQARSLEPLVSRCGAIFGLGVGWAMSTHRTGFSPGGAPLLRLARFIVGVLGVLFCWKGLQVVFPREPETLELSFRFLRYGLLAWWIAFLAPQLFLKTGLAAPAKFETTTAP